MAKISPLLKDIDAAQAARFPSIAVLPKTAAPHTTVVNRAEVTDFAADGLPKFGVERIAAQALVEVPGELGPNGEPVLKPINDIHNQARFYGPWTSYVDSNGQRPQGASGAVAEITFYGTGLNLLRYNDSSNRTFNYSVDGGSSTSVTGAWADVILARNYNANIVFPLVSGLTPGLHTVKLVSTSNALGVFGYEVLNTAASIFLPAATSYAGSRRLYAAEPSSMSYNSGFESGTLGTRGGHVLVYQKSDGTIAKAVTPTDAAAAYLTSTDHTNEEVLRTYHFREFGAGRSDDFSTLMTSAGNRAFTLDDGTTTLAGKNCALPSGTNLGKQAVGPSTASGDHLTLTFVGTGLDIKWIPDSAATNTSADAFEFFIDGVSIGNMDVTSTIDPRIKKVVSGLPYGTHTCQIKRNSPDTWTIHVQDFIIYGPKKPTVPSDAAELADYFLMADYAADLTYGSNAKVSTGVLRKMPTREAVYSGTWTFASIDPGFASGFNLRSNTNGSYFELTFFGTGLNMRMHLNDASYAQVFSVDGAAPGPNSSFTYQGSGLLYDSSTGSMSGIASGTAGYGGAIFQITGLALGVHKVRITYSGGSEYLYASAFDIITPLHAPKFNTPGVLQNALPVGSCAIRDLRTFSEMSVKALPNWVQAVGVAVHPTTTSTAFVPLPDMSCTIKTSGNPIEVSFTGNFRHSTSAISIYARVYVDGVGVGMTALFSPPGGNYVEALPLNVIVPVSAGVHKVEVYWFTDSGTATADLKERLLKVREI